MRSLFVYLRLFPAILCWARFPLLSHICDKIRFVFSSVYALHIHVQHCRNIEVSQSRCVAMSFVSYPGYYPTLTPRSVLPMKRKERPPPRKALLLPLFRRVFFVYFQQFHAGSLFSHKNICTSRFFLYLCSYKAAKLSRSDRQRNPRS